MAVDLLKRLMARKTGKAQTINPWFMVFLAYRLAKNLPKTSDGQMSITKTLKQAAASRYRRTGEKKRRGGPVSSSLKI